MKECVLFDGCIDSGGYGVVHISGNQFKAHRIAYCKAKGLDVEDIKGFVVRHKCDVAKCVNPDHLELGTQKENMEDKVRRNRQAKGCKHGLSKLTPGVVRKIKADYFDGKKSQRMLANIYGVNQSQISRAINGVHWD